MLKKRILTIALMTFGCAQAQWLNHAAPGVPRNKDGKVNLSAKTPRAAQGKPDLSGVWQIEPTPAAEMRSLFGDVTALTVPGDDPLAFSKYFLNILADFKPEDAPMRPEAVQLFLARARTLGTDNPTSRCLPLAAPADSLLAFPFKIVQTPGLIVILYEADGAHRQIYLDGRKHPDDPQPAWLGYSVGKWEADTLLVDTMGFNDRGWLDAFGHPHSEALRVQERYRRRDFGHMEMQATIDDPKSYTKPFTIKFNQNLVPDSDVLESFCNENEKDRSHMGH